MLIKTKCESLYAKYQENSLYLKVYINKAFEEQDVYLHLFLFQIF